MYTPFAHTFAYAIKQTPYAFVAKIILCMYLLYAITLLRPFKTKSVFSPFQLNIFMVKDLI